MVNVVLKGRNNSTSTDMNGNHAINITLDSGSIATDEVVVEDYGEQKKRDITHIKSFAVMNHLGVLHGNKGIVNNEYEVCTSMIEKIKIF